MAATEVAAGYLDGRTAVLRRVTVWLEDGALVVREGANELARWPTGDVRRVAGGDARSAVRLRCGHGGDARLVLPRDDDSDRMLAACPHLDRAAGSGVAVRALLIGGLAAALSIVVLVTVLIPAFAAQFARAVPRQLEAQLGAAVGDQLVALLASPDERGAECRTAEGQAALDALAATLAGRVEPPPAVNVRVIRSDMVNALALPGGEVMVLGALIRFADHADELAGVLAHEIAHIAHRHPTKVAIERASVSVLIGLFVGDIAGGSAVAGLGNLIVGAAYGRDAEREADALGASLMAGAGFDVDAMTRFLERLEREHADALGLPDFLASHPTTDDRVEAIRRRSPPVPARPALDAEAWAAVKAICD